MGPEPSHYDSVLFADNFDFSMLEALAAFRHKPNAYFYVEFRPKTLIDIVEDSGMWIAEIAQKSKINEQTFRKARKGGAVAQTTASGIIRTLIDNERASSERRSQVLLRQPSVRLFEGKPTGMQQLTLAEYMERYKTPELGLENIDSSRQQRFEFG